jgi:carbohydrate kinase (thermoresistant glucokinase family)
MGCGKTTIGQLLSQKLGWPFHEGDDFHPKANVEKMRAGIALTDADRFPWLERLRDEIKQWLSQSQKTLLACSALKQAYRDLLGIDQKFVISVYLKGPYEILAERIMRRQHPYMNKDLLQSQLDILEEPAGGLRLDIAPSREKIVRTIISSLNLHNG